MKLNYFLNDSKLLERMTNVDYILCKKVNATILKNTMMIKLSKPFKIINYLISFNNQPIPIPNIYVTDDLTFLAILMGNEHSSNFWCLNKNCI